MRNKQERQSSNQYGRKNQRDDVILYKEIISDLTHLGWTCELLNAHNRFYFIAVQETNASIWINGSELCIAQACHLPPLVKREELSNPEKDIIAIIHETCIKLASQLNP